MLNLFVPNFWDSAYRERITDWRMAMNKESFEEVVRLAGATNWIQVLLRSGETDEFMAEQIRVIDIGVEIVGDEGVLLFSDMVSAKVVGD